jgi:hypothetical protein
LSGAIADRAVLCDALARHGERAAIFSQLAVHAAHTMALLVLETWEARGAKK